MKTDVTTELLKLYFTGELSNIIKRLKAKNKRQLSDDIYCTLYGIDYSIIKPGKVNTHSDPTGNRAAKIADLYYERLVEIERYQEIMKEVEDFLKELNRSDRIIIQSLVLDQPLTNVAKETGIYYEKARRRAHQLINIARNKLTPP
ncbi:hypothetical protein [Halothermothrix orenii]|uniref:Uncharacterized protein n=1 Tax=Halothermothrix orenii (strain H 168 / OCM 544 / DSM 9562) TaxID=373903 RepID=B8D1P1_HALOH|nr:hypothetical protein [Halothermothrix orenii]ACL69118.1 hypothetical protein Hore_03570 [Halothermothrix orenii H 168]